MPRLARPSPAMMVALIALLVSLRGTGYAALKLPRNSVGAKQLKTGSVRGPEIRNGQVRGADLRNGTVASRDVANETLVGGDVRNGALGGEDMREGSLGGGDIANGSIGGGDVRNSSLTGAKLVNGSLDGSELGAGVLTPHAFARVAENGALFGDPEETQGIEAADIQRVSAGIYCFGGLDFEPKAVMASVDNAMNTTTNATIAMVLHRGTTPLGGCDATHQQARVVTREGNANVDSRFFVWFVRGPGPISTGAGPGD